MIDILWNPIIRWPLAVALALLVLAGVLWSSWKGLHSARRAIISGGLRAAALLVLVLVMFQPQRRHEEVTILKPQLAVLIDSSESMSDPADETQPRRAERVKEWLASPPLTNAAATFDVRNFSFDSRVSEQPAEARDLAFKGGVSNVVSAVNQVQERFRGQPLAGIAVLTDGLDTSGAARGATMVSGAPVLTFELEKAFAPKEKGKRISLGGVDYPARVVVGWDSEIRATLVGSGLSGQTVGVELWRDGRKDREATAAFNEDEQTRTVTFPLAMDKAGMMQFELRVVDAAADKEAQSYPFLIEALAPGKRILYLQNSLGFDFKFLRKAIVSDRNLQLSAFVRWADGRIVSMGERGMPAEAKVDLTATGLSKYAVVMLGDLPPETLTADQYASLKEFVNRGGGLVLLGGPNALPSADLARTPLGELSPVTLPAEYREANTVVTITEAGLRHPVFGPLFNTIKDFPPLLTVNVAPGVPPTAEVLMEGNVGGKTVPLVASMRFGQGRVVAVTTDTVWRWRLAAKSWGSEKSPYDTFWTQLMDWLIPKEQDKQNSNQLELFTERSNYLHGERPELRAILRLVSDKEEPPATLPLTVKTPDDKTFEYTLKPAMIPTGDGRQVPGYRAEVEPNVAGVFAAKSGITLGGEKVEGEARFVVTKPATELTGKPIDRELLQRIAEQTGGRFYSLEDRDQWLANVHHKEQQFARVQVDDLWNNPLILTLLLGLVASDWIARKRWNLP